MTREVGISDAVVGLRCLLQSPPRDPPAHHDLPNGLPADARVTVDVRGIVGWLALGLHVLSSGMALEQVLAAVERFLVALAMRRAGGNLTHAARALGVSRRRVRGVLKPRLIPEGTRVVAIEHVETRVVHIYGHGVYEGLDRPPDGTPTRLGLVTRAWPATFFVPCIKLDSGAVVYGPQCTWVTEDEYATSLAVLRQVVVPVPDPRRADRPRHAR